MDYPLQSSVQLSCRMGELLDDRAHMLHAGECRAFEEVLGICSLSGGLSHEAHSNAIHRRQDSTQGLALI